MVLPITAQGFYVREGYIKTVTIPSASIATLHSVGYTLLTAPTNATISLTPFYIFAKVTSQGSAYTTLHAMTIGHFSSTPATLSNILCTIPATGFLDQTTPMAVFATPFGTTGGILGVGTGIGINMATGDPAAGTNPSPMVVKINYIAPSVS